MKDKSNPFLRKPDHPNYLRRSAHHDYNRPARYLITIMSAPHLGALSIITQDLKSSSKILSKPTPAGECFIRAIPDWLSKYPQIDVACYAVMPDHVHICIDVKAYMKNGLSRAIAMLMGMTTQEHKSLLRADHNQDSQLPKTPAINAEMTAIPLTPDMNAKDDANLKGIISIKEEKWLSFFKKGFNDRIAYSFEHWEKQKRYVMDNPRRYLMKKRFPQLFFMRWRISMGEYQYIAKGNIHLLKNPEIRAVRFSRRYSREEYDAKLAEWERCIFNNGTIASPFIHPNEKKVRDKALHDGASIIRICENGFSDRFTPQGVEFEYNATGQILLIAPLHHDSQKDTLTYAKAQSLNQIAERIAATDWLAGEGRITPI